MKMLRSTAAIAALTTTAMLVATTASAQATRTWVSGTGDDANPCSRTAPCKTFAGAISKTAAGGEINCLDPGGFGAVTITKSLAIICQAGTAGVLVSGTNGIVISAQPTDVVYLEGLDFEGIGTGLSGVLVNTALSVHVVNCIIRGFTTTGNNGNGILVQPSTGSVTVEVVNDRIENNQVGVEVRPSGAGNANVSVVDTFTNNNATGVRANGTTTTGSIAMTVQNSQASGNLGAGYNVTQGTAGGVSMRLFGSLAAFDGTGLRVNGANAVARVGSSTFSSNVTSMATQNGGSILSYGNNQIDDGFVPSTTPLR